MRSFIAAAVLLGLTVASAQAEDSVFKYNLQSKTCKVLPVLPVHNVPIFIMAVNIPSADIAVPGNPGEATLVWYTNYGGQGFDWFEWTGQDFSGLASGGSNKSSTHIIFLGSSDVELQIWSETRLRVCNLSLRQYQGNITMVWGSSTPH